jgi:hypothetical protein
VPATRTFHKWDLCEAEPVSVLCEVDAPLARWLAENPVHPTQAARRLSAASQGARCGCATALGVQFDLLSGVGAGRGSREVEGEVARHPTPVHLNALEESTLEDP